MNFYACWSVNNKVSPYSISCKVSRGYGLVVRYKGLPKCCVVQTVCIQATVNAHLLTFRPEYVILENTKRNLLHDIYLQTYSTLDSMG